MGMTLRLDQLAGLAWIALTILAFVFWWPLGLAILAYTIWSGRMRCCGFDVGSWHGAAYRVNDAREGSTTPRASGNRVFDDYRAATLRRLEEEQREFQNVLARLRLAKDKAEFDQFMAERGNRP